MLAAYRCSGNGLGFEHVLHLLGSVSNVAPRWIAVSCWHTALEGDCNFALASSTSSEEKREEHCY